MRRLVCVAVATILILGGVVAGPAQAKSCYAYSVPDYNIGRMFVGFLIDLQECWGSDEPFIMKGRIERSSGMESQVEKDRAVCSADEPCRLRIFMEHPEVEIAEYVLSVTFQPHPEARQVTQRLEMWCVSGPLYTTECYD